MSRIQLAPGKWSGKRFQAWFDKLEDTLWKEAAAVGLLEHSTLVGTAREFLVKRVLKSILPPAVHIGSGRVFDGEGNSSKQVDIILYDSRLPVFEIDDGIGEYPIEGVLATIEVKSTLTINELKCALSNCTSVLRLAPGIPSGQPFSDKTRDLVERSGKAPHDAFLTVGFQFLPASYIFAFNSRMRMKSLSSNVERWWNANDKPELLVPLLPRVVVAGETVALLNDGFIRFTPPEEVRANLTKKYGNDARQLMVVWDTKRRFGWFALHLLHTVCARIGADNAVLGLGRKIDHYLQSTAEAYFQEHLADSRCWSIPWVPKTV